MPIHLLLRDEFRHAMLDRLGCAGSNGNIGSRFQLDDVQLTALDGRDRASIRRKIRVDPAFPRQLGHARVRPGDDVQFARKRDE